MRPPVACWPHSQWSIKATTTTTTTTSTDSSVLILPLKWCKRASDSNAQSCQLVEMAASTRIEPDKFSCLEGSRRRRASSGSIQATSLQLSNTLSISFARVCPGLSEQESKSMIRWRRTCEWVMIVCANKLGLLSRTRAHSNTRVRCKQSIKERPTRTSQWKWQVNRVRAQLAN